MPDLQSFLFQRWNRTPEYDTAGNLSYRALDVKLPRARGREGLELRPDGTLIEFRIGRDDRPIQVIGQWRQLSENRLRFALGRAAAPKEVEIVFVDDSRLELRPGVALTGEGPTFGGPLHETDDRAR